MSQGSVMMAGSTSKDAMMELQRVQSFDWEAELAGLPNRPGVYRMFDAHGALIYVGKAKVLKHRVRQYFQRGNRHSSRIQSMVDQIAAFDTIVTSNEVEALILESNLIKQYRPPYNILLRDDKRYPWIALGEGEYPRIFTTRNPKKNRSSKVKYFGPYASSGDMYTMIRLIRKHFPLRQRRKPLFKDRPCLNYSLGLCPGPCQGLISPEDYGKTLRQVELFLKGQTDELLELVRQDMEVASEALLFEEAAKLRDRYRAVSSVASRQVVVVNDSTLNEDVVACAREEQTLVMTVMAIRRGKLIRVRHHEVKLSVDTTTEEAYSSFVYQLYSDVLPEDVPHALVLEYPVEDESWLEEALTAIKDRKVSVLYPKRGHRKELLELAKDNARRALENAQLYDASQNLYDPIQALMSLQEALELPDFPARMECYDISHVQGTETVASMVVFTDGVPDKSQYRRFKIQCAEGKPNDFESMHEVIYRRFRQKGDDAEKWDEPDLVIIDGGKGQLSSAVKALTDHGIVNQPIISLAKRFEEVFLPGKSRPILLPPDSPTLYLLQQIRDEAHRFAITYHRKRRGKRATQSRLDDIPGIGPKRKQLLLDEFKTVTGVLRANVVELASALHVSQQTAQTLYDALHRSPVSKQEEAESAES